MITKRQRHVLTAIARAARRGVSLSIRDIADRLDLKSPATVYRHLQALEEQGFVKRTGRSRRYRLVRTPGIPIAGRLRGGAPIENPDRSPLGELALDADSLKGDGTFVALRVEDDSLEEAAILNGDYVVVRKQQRVENGEVAALLVDGCGTLRRVYVGRKRGEPTPYAARFSAFGLRADADTMIYGRLVAVIRGALRVH
jgi:repressor LexA